MSAAVKEMPKHVASARRGVCKLCDQQCQAFLSGKIDHYDPHASCPRRWPRRWGCWGRCDDGTTIRPIYGRRSIPLGTKARRLALALGRWIKSGFGLANRALRRQRQAICEACPMWRLKGNAGLGECLDPRCGCSKLKRWLPGESCPQGKWPAMTRQSLFRTLATALKSRFLAFVSAPKNQPDSKTGRNSS